MRLLLVLLAIVTVVACPYECAVKRAAARAVGSAAQPACCDHCHLGEPPGDESPSQLPVPADDAPWCLCEGAVFEASSRSLADDAHDGAFQARTLWLSAAPLALNARSWTPRFETSRVPAPPEGRLTRISLGSLLI